MNKPPSSPSHKKARGRKGTPCRAPGKSSNKAGAAGGQMNTSGALLLLALLREGRKGHPFDNTRHKSPSPFSPSSSSGGALDGGKRRRERDTLPPPPVGYGRGKRSASATVSNAGDAPPSASGSAGVHEQHQPNAGHAATRSGGGATTAGRKGKGKGDTAAGSGKRVGRAQSVESSAVEHHLTVAAHHSNNMSRSSSTGTSAHHHAQSTHSHSPLHPHEVEHVPSPLARSFSLSQEHSRSSSGSPVAQGVVRERESRKLDAPHHLQGYELGVTYAA